MRQRAQPAAMFTTTKKSNRIGSQAKITKTIGARRKVTYKSPRQQATRSQCQTRGWASPPDPAVSAGPEQIGRGERDKPVELALALL